MYKEKQQQRKHCKVLGFYIGVRRGEERRRKKMCWIIASQSAVEQLIFGLFTVRTESRHSLWVRRGLITHLFTWDRTTVNRRTNNSLRSCELWWIDTRKEVRSSLSLALSIVSEHKNRSFVIHNNIRKYKKNTTIIRLALSQQPCKVELWNKV